MSSLAILGPKGTFSEEAAIKFDPKLQRLFCNSIEEVFERVQSGKAFYGIVPVENSLEGSVFTTLEMLLKGDVKVCKEIDLDVNHYLLALPNTKLNEVKEIISHPHAIAQCRDFLKSLGNIKTRNFASTAEAAREVAKKKLIESAAIAPKIASKIYKLRILEEKIQDRKHNQTRFFVIARKCPEPLHINKTSIVIGLKDRPGALYEVLGHFARENVNLTKIESRPSKKGLGDYIFFIDFTGDSGDRKIKKILEELKELTTTLKVLGSYATD